MSDDNTAADSEEPSEEIPPGNAIDDDDAYDVADEE
jgi:hypothetical protein